MDVTINKLVAYSTVVIISLLSSYTVWGYDLSTMTVNCPQQRSTEKAPEHIYSLKNPLQKSEAAMEAAEDLFLETSGQVPCVKCHGRNGNGRGIMVSMLDPPPRNFSCAKTIGGVPDGQLFWIIKNGSAGTGMPAFDHLSDEQVWQLVHYIRKL